MPALSEALIAAGFHPKNDADARLLNLAKDAWAKWPKFGSGAARSNFLFDALEAEPALFVTLVKRWNQAALIDAVDWMLDKAMRNSVSRNSRDDAKPQGERRSAPTKGRLEPMPTMSAAPLPSIFELASKAVQESHDRQGATERFVRMIGDNEQYMEQLIGSGVTAKLSSAQANINKSLANNAESQDAKTAAAMEKGLKRFQLAYEGRMTLFEHRLPITGKCLGDATADDLINAYDFYGVRAEKSANRQAVYRKIHEKLVRSNKKTVREGVKLSELEIIMTNVSNEDDAI